ncbi:hypothetical protein C0J52_08114 [Blattella germanica]|nr:hypothetical protein C0J52_08114 [Blattella germanica]
MCYNITKCIEMVAEGRSAILLPEFATFYIQVLTLDKERKKPRVIPIDEIVYSVHLGVYVRSLNCLIYNRLEELMHRLSSAGINSRFLKLKRSRMAYYYTTLTTDHPFVFTVGHLQGAFYILLIGIFIAFAVFIFENIQGGRKVTWGINNDSPTSASSKTSCGKVQRNKSTFSCKRRKVEVTKGDVTEYPAIMGIN